LIGQLPAVQSAENISAIFDATDIIATLDDGTCRSVQVKTISKAPGTVDSHQIAFRHGYSDQMLIACTNADRTRFFVCLFKDIREVLGDATDCFAVLLNFCKPDHYFAAYMFTDEHTAAAELSRLLPMAALHKQETCASHQKEIEMWGRLEDLCRRHGIDILRNGNPNSSIDGWVGGRAVQLKYRSRPIAKGATFKVPLKQYAGYLNGQEVYKPYAEKDPFDFVIVELGGTDDEPAKHHGQFCTLPKSLLVDHGTLSTATTPGKFSVNVVALDYPKAHWSLEHWTTFTRHFARAAVARAE
jgi:hypothetical protein